MNVYNEVRLDGKRKFTIAENGVLISANIVMGPSYETHVDYVQMDSRISVIREHHKLFWWSIVGVPFFAITTFIVVDSLKFPLFDFLPGLFLGLTIISLLVGIMTRKRIEYARFCSTAGLPLMDIARAGPDSENFDEFVAAIQNRIETIQTAG